MSRLDELIQELCPDGVEQLKISEVTNYEQPSKYIVDSTDYSDDFNTPVLTAGQTFILGYTNETEGIYEASKDKPVIIFDDFTGALKWVDFPFKVKSSALKLITANNKILIRYLYHTMENIGFTSDEHKRLWISIYSEIKVAVPPLEVQREIVRILDSFMLLTAELTAELTARKSQYEFYRDELLKVDGSIKTVALEEIADIGTGSSNTNEGLEEGLYPFYVRSQEPLRKNEYEYDETAIITAGDGVGVGKVYHYVEGKYALHQRAYRIHINTPEVLPKYYFHYMKSTFLPYIQKTMFQGSVASIRRPMLNKFPVPVPSLEVQKKIIDVLENFESICNDLNIGLPAEIEARQKQYEYYRDALLTYAVTGKIIAQTDRQTDRQTSIIKLIQFVYGSVKISLGTIGKVSMCKRILKSETSSIGEVPFFKIGTFGGEPNAYISKDTFEKYKKEYSYPKKGDILISAAGTIGRTVVFDGEPAYFQDSNIVWIDNDESLVLNSYLYYYYQLQPWKASTGGTIARLYNDNIRDAVISVPSLEEQERIVSILDRFDTLCNDLSSGLPAEIEARQKQYEYYRDRLINFEPITE